MKSYSSLYTAIAVLFTYGAALETFYGCEKVRKCPCVESSLSPGTLNINCSGMDLTIIPTNFPAKVLSLDFSNNFARPERLRGLCRYKQLGTVSLARNHLSKLQGDQFGACDVIDTLDMSGNEFHELNDSSLHGLHYLRNLIGIEARDFHSNTFTNLTSLRHLKIVLYQTSIPPNLFDGLQLESLEIIIKGATKLPRGLFDSLSSTLNTLTITSDSLQWIDPDQLSKLVGLKKISMTCKGLRLLPETLFSETKNLINMSLTLTSVPRNIFRTLNSLRSLKLYYLEDMPSELFEGLFELNSLEVSKSTLSQIPDGWFNDLYKLEELILKDNGIIELKAVDFKNLHSLKSLDLSGNKIRELKNGVIVEIAETVEHVNLSSNFLKRIYVRNLAGTDNLTVLDLSKNDIYRIESGTFRDMHMLQQLYLGHNKLTELPEKSFASNAILLSLDLSSNIFSTIPEGLFNSTSHLRTINLSGNNLRGTGPSSMYPTQTLARIDFSYNIITCDCDSFELVLDMRNATVLGNCEEPETEVLISEFKPEQVCPNIPTTSTATVEITQSPFLPDTDSSSSIRISSGTTSSGIVNTSSKPSATNVTEFKPDVETTTNTIYPPLPIRVSTEKPTLRANPLPTLELEKNYSDKPDTNTTTIHRPLSVSVSTEKPATKTKPPSTLELEKDSGTSKNNRVSKTVTVLNTTITLKTTNNVSFVSKNDGIKNETSVDGYEKGNNHEEIPVLNTTNTIPRINPNVTVDPGQIVVYRPVTAESHRIAVASIVAVAVLCILIILGLLYKRRRRSQYEVTEVRSGTANEDEQVSLNQLKDVPSIQIETVDASDNVKIEIYQPK